MFEIRGGKACSRRRRAPKKTWADLTGASPDKGAAFFLKS